MARNQVLICRFSENEKTALTALARRDKITKSEVVRFLVKSEARRLGVWPNEGEAQKCDKILQQN